MGEKHEYFSVDPTSMVIPKSGALAIICGDAPRRNAVDGTTSYSLRGPLLIIPPELWDAPDEIAAKVARVLNDNAHLFFDSAATQAHPRWRLIADEPPPDDGRDLLLHQEGWAISPVIVGRVFDDTWLSDYFEIDAPDQRPTHWMPLPEAPQ